MVLKKIEELSFGKLRTEFKKISDEDMISDSFAIVRLTVHLKKHGKDPFTYQFETENPDDEGFEDQEDPDNEEFEASDVMDMKPALHAAVPVSGLLSVSSDAAAASESFSTPLEFSLDLAIPLSSTGKSFKSFKRGISVESGDYFPVMAISPPVIEQKLDSPVIFLWVYETPRFRPELWPPYHQTMHESY